MNQKAADLNGSLDGCWTHFKTQMNGCLLSDPNCQVACFGHVVGNLGACLKSLLEQYGGRGFTEDEIEAIVRQLPS